MEIIIGKTAGFCYGVRRAIEGTKKEIENDKTKNIYCLGELVHNKQVIQDLEKEGLIFINNISDAKEKVIIRAHGVEKSVYNQAINSNIKLVDYTCPKVLNIHKIAQKYAKEGYYIFLCGSKNHPENIGTISYCGKNACVIEDEEDVFNGIKKFKKANIQKLLLISQTTYRLEKFYIIEKMIKNEIDKKVKIVVNNTICKATELRQEETLKISKEVDYMIIIGGENSSNTRKLYEIAKKNCKNYICVETAKDLKIDELKKANKIGIMAGASTPKESIEGVYRKIKSI